jgi:hypothetical protein
MMPGRRTAIVESSNTGVQAPAQRSSVEKSHI